MGTLNGEGVAEGDVDLERDAWAATAGADLFVRRVAEAPGGGEGDGAAQAAAAAAVEVDMFGATPVGAAGPGPGDAAGVAGVGAGAGGGQGLVDNYDDAEGYYKWRTGEMLAGRYEVFAAHGKGVFGSVLRARDHKSHALTLGGQRPEVAIKMARANDTMYKQAQSERAVLAKLAQTDPENRAHCIRMLDYFEYRGHACLVFESMDMNLRTLVRKFGRDIGLSLQAVRAYAIQLLFALRHLRQNGILHADIKPDNILVSADRSVIKICDFGSALFG